MPALSTLGGGSARSFGFSAAGSTALRPGSWGVQFNGTNQWVAAAANEATRLGFGDFTIEGFFKTSYNGGNNQVLIEQSVVDESTGNNSGWLLYITSAGNIVFGGAAGQIYINVAMPIYLGLWTHVALVRSSSTIRLYVNGSLIASTGTSIDFNAAFNTGRTDTPTLFGSHEMQLAGGWFNGHLSNWRIVKGTAVYTSLTNFTVPAVPLTAIPGTGLLTFQTNSLLDTSSNNITISQIHIASTGSGTTFNGGPAVTAELFASIVTSAILSVSAEVLIVAGGGGGAYFANARAGGGGAGGLLYYGSFEAPKTPNGSGFIVTPGTTYPIVVGGGGLRSEPGVGNSQGTGGVSSVFGFTAAGGGGGGYNDSPAVGWPGGSGGGGFIGAAGGAGTVGQGNAGGAGYAGGSFGSGGGGGAGAAGGAGQPFRGGNGGNGLQYSISGTATYYAGGGSGDVYFDFGYTTNPGTPGLGGGGLGYNDLYQRGPTPFGNGNHRGTSGAPNTGGGGGSGSDGSTGLGGSGIVIIRTQLIATSTTGSPSITIGANGGSFNIYRFTGTGSITF